MNGWTPTTKVQPATQAQLIALRDLLLSHGDKNAADAVDNVIDILTIAASEPVSNFVRASNPALNSGVRFVVKPYVGRTTNNPMPELKPYTSNSRHAIADDHESHSWTVDGS